MTRRRWIADEVSGDKASLLGPHAYHLARVLRAQVGQEFDIATGEQVRRGRISSVSDSRVELELGEEIAAAPALRLTLVLAIFKFDRMEWAIEKCTELGVTRIVPTIARRTEAHLAKAAPNRVERWQRIARQAAEQSRRTAPPEITQPLKLEEAVALPGACRILLAETEQQTGLADFLQENGETILAVGPEGGWTESEFALFRDAGWHFASLGNTILRAETAAIAATAIVVSARGL